MQLSVVNLVSGGHALDRTHSQGRVEMEALRSKSEVQWWASADTGQSLGCWDVGDCCLGEVLVGKCLKDKLSRGTDPGMRPRLPVWLDWQDLILRSEPKAS